MSDETDSLKKMSEIDKLLAKLKYISFKIGGKIDDSTYIFYNITKNSTQEPLKMSLKN